MKLLIDTNIIIPMEATSASDIKDNTPEATSFAQLANQGGHTLYLHPELRTDLNRDEDHERRESLIRQTDKYPNLPDAPPISPMIESQLGVVDPGSNDWVDHLLLAALHSNAIDFLVTEDRGIHIKARRLGLSDRVVTLNQAQSILEALLPKPSIHLPAVEQTLAHRLNPTDSIFESFRDDYPLFDRWLSKCQIEHRTTWIIKGVDGSLAAFAIVNPEQNGEYGLRGKVLKICSFKVSDNYTGFRYGELLLKAIFSYGYENAYEIMFLTVFEKHHGLIDLIGDFGFRPRGNSTELGEIVFSKSFVPEFVDNPLEYNSLYGPYALQTEGVDSFIIPIQPRYHALLFPDTEKQIPLLPANFAFGNAIRKAYLCNAATRAVTPGSILYFYRSYDQRAVQCLGICEATLVSTSPDEIARFVGRRTVYSYEQIELLCRQEILAVLFRHCRTMWEAIRYAELESHAILTGPPRSITRIKDGENLWLLSRIAESR